jgi:predicted secreted protein
MMVAVSGCETAPQRHPRGTQTVALSYDHANPEAPIAVITAVDLVLPPGPPGSAGYVWEITSNNIRVLEQMGPMKPASTADAHRAPMTSITFYALKPGRSVLRFVLVRPNEVEATPLAKCEVTVRVSD